MVEFIASLAARSSEDAETTRKHFEDLLGDLVLFEEDETIERVPGEPLIETPMQFVAIEAHPNRSPEDEPEGSGPFGF